MRDDKTSAVDRVAIVKVLSQAATKDQFWGMRVESLVALNGVKEAQDALLAASKDPDARVRARAVGALAATKDPGLAATYAQILSDQSYAVIRSAAPALGQTKSPIAYDALAKLLDSSSWRDNIRASGLTGLAALGDKRALESGLKYSAVGNPMAVRAAALGVLGATGKGDPRVLPPLSAALNEALERRSFQLAIAAGEALVTLGDERGLASLDEFAKRAAGSPQLGSLIASYQARLKAKLASNKPGS